MSIKSIDNSLYGGFVVSKNILEGFPVRYSYREKSSIQQLNGWTMLSEADDDRYLSDAGNFVILSAESVFSFAPVMAELFEAPYGTDICWLYEEGVLVGFHDLKTGESTTIERILEG